MTFIKSDLLPHWVIANVLKVDRENNLAFLALFSYVHNPSERRMHVRITLPEMVEASFHNRKLQLPGAVQEISFSGVALLSPEENPFREKEKGMVSLLLPSSKLDVPGTFLKCQDQQSIHRHIFRLEMNARCERILSQYLYQQQSRIMDELKNISPDKKEEWRL
jgi:c-di-GMP-binding flagellar brake protein YcgR